MIRGSDYQTLVLSSCTAGLFSGVFTNMLEVLKTQVMNDALHDHTHGRVHFRHLSEKLVHACRCYYCFFKDIVKKQGGRTYFKGVGYNTSMSMVRSSILFPLYEFRKFDLTSGEKNCTCYKKTRLRRPEFRSTDDCWIPLEVHFADTDFSPGVLSHAIPSQHGIENQKFIARLRLHDVQRAPVLHLFLDDPGKSIPKNQEVRRF